MPKSMFRASFFWNNKRCPRVHGIQNHQILVLVKKCCSDPVNIEKGVPQGSLLGPLLFSLYVSPPACKIRGSIFKYQVYADDTTLYIPLNTSNPDLDEITNKASEIMDWFSKFGLSLNASKTHICLIKGSRMTLK